MPASSAREPGFATRLIEVTRPREQAIRTSNVPIFRASTVFFDSLEHARASLSGANAGQRGVTSYGTAGTPTTFALTYAIEQIEATGHECHAALLPSGLAAISTCLSALLVSGDHLLMADTVYPPARTFATQVLAKKGVTVSFFDPTLSLDAPGGIASLMRETTRAIYLESPGSHTFELCDTPAICAYARTRGVLTIVDNAWASPLFSKPFDWGADVSVLPLTKYWGGHSDLVMGALVVREHLWEKVWPHIRHSGLCVGADDAYLVLRGLRTVELRLKRHQASALALAAWLEGQVGVARVLHPALPSHPQHALWKRDFSGSGGLFSVELEKTGSEALDRARVAAFCEQRRYFGIGASWGGFESLLLPAHLGATRTVRPWNGGPVIRLFVGLEDVDDLLGDLQDALCAVARITAG